MVLPKVGTALSLKSEECTVCEFSQQLVELPCGHRFCEDCLRAYFRAVGIYGSTPLKHDRMLFRKNGTAWEMKFSVQIGIKCLEQHCAYVVGADWIKKFLDDESYEKFDGKLLKMALYSMDDIEVCPIGCGAIIQSNDCFCHNESCKIQMIKLRELRRIEMKRKEKIDRQKLISWSAGHNARCCPNCFLIIEKNGGCDHMFCTRCSTSYNWSQSKLLAKHILEADLSA